MRTSTARLISFWLILSQAYPASLARADEPEAPRGGPRSEARKVPGLSISDELGMASAGAEYVSGRTVGSVLMRISLWGGVQKPGIWHVPLGTDLVSLISYAGGPSSNAQLDSVWLKRTDAGKNENLKIDVEQMITGKTTNLAMQDPILIVNDIVVVPETKPLFSQNTLLVLSVITTLATITLAGLAINNNFKSK